MKVLEIANRNFIINLPYEAQSTENHTLYQPMHGNVGRRGNIESSLREAPEWSWERRTTT
jgi:hypothetical protein